MGARVALTLKTHTARMGAALACLLLAAGCGNDPNARNLSLDLFNQFREARNAQPPAPPTQADVAQALAGTQGPLELITREDNSGWSMMLRIEENRGYETFGSSDRRTVTLRNGVLTASRGLGGDLMSSDISQVAPLIAARKPGQGTRIMRFIGDDEQTAEIRFSCTVSVGGSVPVKTGAIDTSARQVTETCTTSAREITNVYLVDGAGRSIGSKQWAGPLNGYLLTQTLRR